MKTFKDIKDRVVFIDFPTGAHGHFLSKILNGLVSGNKTVKAVDKNYHSVVNYPLKFDCEEFRSTPLSDIKLGCEVPNNTDTIFWPMHYGGCRQGTAGYADYRVIEIYVAASSYFRYYVNRWMNVATDRRADLLNLDYFVSNFYKIAQSMGESRLINWFAQANNIDKPDSYQYTTIHVLSMLQYQIETDVKSRTNGRRYDVYRTAGTCASVELDEFYKFDQLVTVIDRVKQTFDLKFDVDVSYLQHEWENFVAMQFPTTVESLPTKNNLHIIVQAYLNFLNHDVSVSVL